MDRAVGRDRRGAVESVAGVAVSRNWPLGCSLLGSVHFAHRGSVPHATELALPKRESPARWHWEISK